MELPPYRSRNRRATRDGQSATTRMRRANAAKTFPGSDASPPSDSPDLPLDDDSNAAKTFAGSSQNRPKRSPARAAAAICRGHLSDGDHREAGRRAESATDLAGPGRGVRLRRQLRIGEAVRADDRAKAPRGWCVSLRAWGRRTDRFLPRGADARSATGEWRRPGSFA